MKIYSLIIVLIIAFIINGCGTSLNFLKEDPFTKKRNEAVEVLGDAGGQVYNLYGYWINDDIRIQLNMIIGIAAGSIKVYHRTLSDSTGTYSRSYSAGYFSPIWSICYIKDLKKIMSIADHDDDEIISKFEIDTLTQVVYEKYGIIQF